ncbi:ae113865-5732-4b63-aef8-62f18debdcf8 [Thermothielavioides terrestris]|uniref:Ketoreductase domain-containing protein n=2 Tax=Thermothielavioides terrestris TaxID=2587410 RepID=G2R9G1_THETT|nr:uncharacterized protein THITE_2052988 [Thermothielavioides terrestris NRRL 8126]AEO68702.1 hypothetical protein THITE_2052988 [Thermothielavioides terrestris NRRL 8126]SPQ23027.1 ae113865-5732-4b63-aef8-62f18debdcf8 [Thermothielavioides terrestris]
MPPTKQLTFFITGCSSGFGLILSRIVLRAGHRLIATSRNPSRTPELVEEIAARGGRWLALDVDDPAAGAALIDRLERDEGERIDVLVSNAGYAVFAPVETLADHELRGLMETMYFGPARLVRAVLPYMRARRQGVVVHVSSGAGLEGREGLGGYAAAKAAMDGLCKVLGKEVAPFGVRVLNVHLGGFNTNMANATRAGGQSPWPEDYKGSLVEQFLFAITSGKFVPEGDPEKAMQAVYEVIVGEGVGAGREAERMLPLGRDIAARVKQVQDGYAHAMEVFGEVCNNVYLEGR